MHMEVLARDLRLSATNAGRLKRIAAHYYKTTRKRLVVTGGTRTPARQAQLIYEKIAHGDVYVAQTTPADRVDAEPFLGRYSHSTSVTFVDAGLQLETKNGPFPLLSTSTPGTLALGGVLSSILVVERDDAASGASSLTFGRPISHPLAWPATLERLGD